MQGPSATAAVTHGMEGTKGREARRGRRGGMEGGNVAMQCQAQQQHGGDSRAAVMQAAPCCHRREGEGEGCSGSDGCECSRGGGRGAGVPGHQAAYTGPQGWHAKRGVSMLTGAGGREGLGGDQQFSCVGSAGCRQVGWAELPAEGVGRGLASTVAPHTPQAHIHLSTPAAAPAAAATPPAAPPATPPATPPAAPAAPAAAPPAGLHAPAPVR
ncbi:hypothetical protein HaLaN_19951 [Haematococcus lacustris]|uniref:Uncharacterized protein n=1 Tax=Haematococcus lacustris TaxID=44745 RepID=A0A699ZW50_HAELA|nr:hypothetical protein HaLaN_19951 [Haematococcus lacustris]